MIAGLGVQPDAGTMGEGQPLMTLLTDDDSRLPAAIAELDGTFALDGNRWTGCP